MNSTWYEQADDYLYGRMTQEERMAFESALAEDIDLSAEFELYRAIESTMQQQEAAKEEEENLKRSLAALSETYITSGEQKGRLRMMSRRVYRWTVAAALLLAAIGVYLVTIRNGAGPHRLAEDYIRDRLKILGQTMDGSGEILQQGIAAYNNGDYKKALNLFNSVMRSTPDNSDAKRYSGLVFLQLGNYDSAIARFDTLAALKRLYSNPGLFLKAVTILHRNGAGDIAQARHLLEEVVAQKAEGYEEAAQWLKRF